MVKCMSSEGAWSWSLPCCVIDFVPISVDKQLTVYLEPLGKLFYRRDLHFPSWLRIHRHGVTPVLQPVLGAQ